MTADLNHIARFFVYGTLKRGQCREKCWPYEPQRILTAWTLGRLIDLGEYPAMVEGKDRVWGEVWEYPLSQAAAVLQVLDEIEVTNQPEVENLYDRVICSATTASGALLEAYTYTYARNLPADQRAVRNAQQQDVSWPTT